MQCTGYTAKFKFSKFHAHIYIHVYKIWDSSLTACMHVDFVVIRRFHFWFSVNSDREYHFHRKLWSYPVLYTDNIK